VAGKTVEAAPPKVVQQGEWLATRKTFLKEEKGGSRLRDELSR